MPTKTNPIYNWLCAGDEIFPALIAAIDAAQKSVCFEIYIYQDGPLGQQFRDALVRVLVDAVGSMSLPPTFWNPLQEVGGEVREFNPLALNRFWIRNHRKLLVCDEAVAFVGGFNIAPEYQGDGIKNGWCDLGLKIEGPLVAQLALSFAEMFARADFQHQRFSRLHRPSIKKSVKLTKDQMLSSGPGRGGNPFKRALHQDLARAKNVRLIVAYFLPTWQLRRDLMRVARRGGKVQLILAGRSDVLLSRLAAQSLYRRFLNSNIEIYEYEPQILHAKLTIVDDVVYVGSSNLDPRSLHINYELMTRLENQEIADQAGKIFGDKLKHCRRVTSEEWRKSQTFWRRLKQHWAYFLLNRIDPYLARRQWCALSD